MSIPTRDELLERLHAWRASGGYDADFTVAEIRRAVAEELEALRRSVNGADRLARINARLAALRAEQLKPMPPPAVLGPNHADGCKGNLAYYSGDGYDRVRVCQCGAEDHEPARRETTEPNTAPPTTEDSQRRVAPSGSDLGGAVSREANLLSSNPLGGQRHASSGLAATSTEKPGAADVRRPSESTRGSESDSRATTGEQGASLPRASNSEPARCKVEPPPALSEPEILERAAEIMDRMGSREATPEELRSDAAKLRAASVPKPVDVFEAFAREWFDGEYVHGGPEERTAIEHAREWFGSTVAYVQTMAARPCVQPGKDCGFCDSCEARLDMAALRQRAQEASR